MADKYLNLFFSYDKGGNKNLEKLKQLEDNVTRSFLVTLKNLDVSTQNKFLERLLNKKQNYSNLNFALQSFDKDKSLFINLKKYLLTIGSKKSILLNNDLIKPRKLIYDFERDGKSKKELIKIIDEVLFLIENGNNDNAIKKYLDVIEEKGYKFEHKLDELVDKVRLKDELKIIYELCKGCRPDGWIFNENIIIAIEAKLNNNEFQKTQLQRHLFHKNGIHLRSDEDFIVINVTWDEVVEYLEELKPKMGSNYTKEYFLIEQFKEYCDMSQRKLNLKFITNGDGYDREIAKEQFPLLLTKLDEEIKNYFPDLKRANRPLADYIWDYYGRVINGKVKQDPHYSIYFDVDGAGIFLTIKDKSKIKRKFKKIINNGDFYNIIKRNVLDTNSISAVNRTRYRLELIKYKPIYNLLNPEKQHHQKGETITLFKFCISLAGLGFNKDSNIDDHIDKFKEQLINITNLADQFEFGLRIEYPKQKIGSKKQDQISSENSKLFNDENLLIDYYIKFIKETFKIYSELLE